MLKFCRAVARFFADCCDALRDDGVAVERYDVPPSSAGWIICEAERDCVKEGGAVRATLAPI